MALKQCNKNIGALQQKFGAYGFKPETFLPVYGAESVGVTASPPGRPLRVDQIDQNLKKNTSCTRIAENQKNSLEFVSCGPLCWYEVRIVDEK